MIGRKERIRYHSHAKTLVFEDEQKTKEKDELVDFTVEQKIVAVEQKTVATEPSNVTSEDKEGLISYETTVIDKDGLVDLHDLAFPELGEILPIVFKSNGEVVRAGTYPRTSVFYVPPIPLPKTNVKVGDTWTTKKQWLGSKNGIPLELNVTTIFKEVYRCGPSRCAHLEISGDVKILGALQKSLLFKSRVHGYLLFSLETGAVIWSEVHSRESINSQSNQVIVSSCLSAHLISPEKEALYGKEVIREQKKMECQPGVATVPPLPQI